MTTAWLLAFLSLCPHPIVTTGHLARTDSLVRYIPQKGDSIIATPHGFVAIRADSTATWLRCSP